MKRNKLKINVSHLSAIISKKSLKYIFFVTGLFFLYLLTVGKGIINSKDKLTFSLFSEKSSISKSENSDLKQLEFSNVANANGILNLSSASIDLISFNSGLTYFPRGSISVLFEPKGVFPRDNVFQLEMSNGSGSFNTPTVIASKDDFFIPILNGIIPLGTPTGSGYKLRISYGPLAGPRLFFEIPNTFAVGTAPVSFDIPFISFSNEAYGIDFSCLNNPNTTSATQNYFFGSLKQSNNSTLGTNLEISQNANGTWGSSTIKMYSLNNQNQWVSQTLPRRGSVNPFFEIPSSTAAGYHLIEFTKDISGKKLTYSYLFHFNTGNTGFSNLSSDSLIGFPPLIFFKIITLYLPHT